MPICSFFQRCIFRASVKLERYKRRTKLARRSVGECESDTAGDDDMNEQQNQKNSFLMTRRTVHEEWMMQTSSCSLPKFLLVNLAVKKSSRCFVTQVMKVVENSIVMITEKPQSFLKKIYKTREGGIKHVSLKLTTLYCDIVCSYSILGFVNQS